ncbi:MAG: response regulator [Pyrinomonadaceae bacterium]|jgi:DNA-binding response OmpR family regulator|nr:response regulator [Pyrinomonadaceae bacterium]
MNIFKGRILCTEDDADTRELIAWVLTDQGFDVICANSASHALELAKGQHFDLYLMDRFMPGLSGTELTKKLREFDIKTPILFTREPYLNQIKKRLVWRERKGTWSNQ